MKPVIAKILFEKMARDQTQMTMSRFRISLKAIFFLSFESEWSKCAKLRNMWPIILALILPKVLQLCHVFWCRFETLDLVASRVGGLRLDSTIAGSFPEQLKPSWSLFPFRYRLEVKISSNPTSISQGFNSNFPTSISELEVSSGVASVCQSGEHRRKKNLPQ